MTILFDASSEHEFVWNTEIFFSLKFMMGMRKFVQRIFHHLGKLKIKYCEPEMGSLITVNLQIFS
jgi:hypothetical protein